MNLTDKVAVVTGGTGGLGWRICRSLAAAGMKVALVYVHSEQKATQYVGELRQAGATAIAVKADVTAQEGVNAIIEQVEQELGPICALVLNAAYNTWIPFAELEQLDEAIWNYSLNFNLTAPFLAMRRIGSAMKKRGEGRIVTISSVAGLYPAGSSMAYAVSKAALIHLTRCMAVALGPAVLVNSVAPGLMEGTRMTDNLAHEYVERSRAASVLGRAANKDDVADAVLTMVRTDSITGQTLVVDSGKVFH